MTDLTVVEVCAGAGGQSLGLHRAGFQHQLAVEIDQNAARTLQANLGVPVAVGDVADPEVWNPSQFEGVSLFAGGVPCPPFSIAGQQRGSADERDLFAWAIEQIEAIRPKAVMLENVRGLSGPRFSAYRQRALDRLMELGYVGEWKLLTSADFGVPQLRPRFVLVAMAEEDMAHFYWPEPTVSSFVNIGDALHGLMASNGWKHADEWRSLARGVAPTIVGGSKKHGGADLGPTRAKEGWAKLFVDGKGVADAAPDSDSPSAHVRMPRLTVEMVARVQGWQPEDEWEFFGGKTSQYRQVGNAFPPPVAQAIGQSISAALQKTTSKRSNIAATADLHDPVYTALSRSANGMTLDELVRVLTANSRSDVERSMSIIRKDFELEESFDNRGVVRFRLGDFKGFVGQRDHARHEFILNNLGKVS